MGRKPKAELTEKNIKGLKYFKQLLPLFERWHSVGTARDKAGNRKLHYDHYCAYILLFLFNPIVNSLRGIQRASKLKKVQKKLGCPRTSLAPACAGAPRSSIPNRSNRSPPNWPGVSSRSRTTVSFPKSNTCSRPSMAACSVRCQTSCKQRISSRLPTAVRKAPTACTPISTSNAACRCAST